MKFFLRLLSLVCIAGLLIYGATSGSDVIWMSCLYLSMLPLCYLIFSMIPVDAPDWKKNTWRIVGVLMASFIMLSLQLLRQQFIIADTYATTPVGGLYNPRLLNAELRVVRGRIYDRNGIEIAGRVITKQGYVRRTYSDPSTSYIAGYFTPDAVIGKSALEKAYDDYLSGRAGDPIERLRSKVFHTPMVGNDLVLTLDARLQNLGQRLLGSRRGAIVMMNPKTGEVLTLVSNPTYNAQDLTMNPDPSVRNQEINRLREELSKISSGADARLINRALQGLYSPGSTFKTVTAAAAIDLGVAEPDDIYEDDGEFVVGGHIVRDPNRPDESKTKWTLLEAYKWSLNAVFAQVGLQVEAAGLREYARRFGFEKRIPFDLPISISQLAKDPADLSNRVLLADTAFGQGEILATPMEINLITSTIANEGVMPAPYLVKKIVSPSGRVIEERSYTPLEQVVSKDTAQKIKEMMVATVDSGSGQNAKIPGVKVAGKTGTAQLGEGQAPHAWFTAFAPADNPQFAVTVLVENGGEGYKVAAPIAKAMLQAALQEYSK